jgi:hypothetical protein
MIINLSLLGKERKEKVLLKEVVGNQGEIKEWCGCGGRLEE